MACKEDLEAAKAEIKALKDELKAEKADAKAKLDALRADRDDLKDKLGKLRTKLAQEAKEMRLKRANVGRQAHHGKGSS